MAFVMQDNSFLCWMVKQRHSPGISVPSCHKNAASENPMIHEEIESVYKTVHESPVTHFPGIGYPAGERQHHAKHHRCNPHHILRSSVNRHICFHRCHH